MDICSCQGNHEGPTVLMYCLESKNSLSLFPLSPKRKGPVVVDARYSQGEPLFVPSPFLFRKRGNP